MFKVWVEHLPVKWREHRVWKSCISMHGPSQSPKNMVKSFKGCVAMFDKSKKRKCYIHTERTPQQSFLTCFILDLMSWTVWSLLQACVTSMKAQQHQRTAASPLLQVTCPSVSFWKKNRINIAVFVLTRLKNPNSEPVKNIPITPCIWMQDENWLGKRINISKEPLLLIVFY